MEHLPHGHGTHVSLSPQNCLPCTGKFLHRLRTLLLSSKPFRNFLSLLCPRASLYQLCSRLEEELGYWEKKEKGCGGVILV